MWFYRDWVVGAINRDLPYDQFVIAAACRRPVAGAPRKTKSSPPGFLRNSMLNEEGGIDPEQFRMEAMFDRMDAIGKSVLGLTIQCAQCHTHKFDPLDARRVLPAVRVLEQRPRVAARRLHAGRNDANRRVATRDAGDRGRFAAPHADWPERMAKWEAEVEGECSRVGGARARGIRRSRAAARNCRCSQITRCCAPAMRRRNAGYRVVARQPSSQRHGDAAGAIDRSEFAVRRPGAVVQGDVALDGDQDRGRAGDRRSQESSRSKSPRRPRIFRSRKRRWSRTSTTTRARSASSGRSSSPSTARTRPRGASTPDRAAATRRGRRCSSSKSRSTSRRRGAHDHPDARITAAGTATTT